MYGNQPLWCLLTDAEKILDQPDHCLEEGDEESVIKIRLFQLPVREILVTGENKMSARMMKNYFKKHGDVEKVTEKGKDKLQFIVTFVKVEGGSLDNISFFCAYGYAVLSSRGYEVSKLKILEIANF